MTDGPDGHPRVSVVLCVRNGGALLDHQLEALAAQRINEEWELVVVDNGCTDDSMARVEHRAHTLPNVTVVPAYEKAGLSYARNVGAAAARGEIVAFCDADDVVRPDWLANLIRPVVPGRMAGGALDFERLNSEEARFWRGFSTRMPGLPIGFDYLPHVMGANFAITKTDLAEVGGFDEVFIGSSDEVDLCFRAQQHGMEVAFAADAIVDYRLRGSIREAGRQLTGYGRSAALLYRKHRGRMPSPTVRQTLTPYWFLLTHIHQLVRGRGMRGRWVCIAAYRRGRIAGSNRAKVWFV